MAFVCSGSPAQAHRAGASTSGGTYQHIPLPAQLPKGVSVKDAQHLQALIDDYNLQEPLVTTKVKTTCTW